MSCDNDNTLIDSLTRFTWPQESGSANGIVPVVLSMLPFPSDTVLDAVIAELIVAAYKSPALQGDLARVCYNLAEADQADSFVTIAYKGWYFDVSGTGEHWDGLYAGNLAAKSAARRYVSFGRRLAEHCGNECDRALARSRESGKASSPNGSSLDLYILFSFAAHLCRVGILSLSEVLGYAMRLLARADDTEPISLSCIDAFCSIVVSYVRFTHA